MIKDEASFIDNEEIVNCVIEYQNAKNERNQKKLINLVFLSYRSYLKSIVRTFLRRSNDPFDDLYQVASIGLIKAMQTFNKETSATFKTYANQLIIGEIRHYLRDKTSMIKAPRQMRELSYRIYKISNEFYKKMGREPSDNEVSEILSVSDKKVIEAKELERRTTPYSIDELSLVSDAYLSDALSKDAKDEYEKNLSNLDNQLVLNEALSKLDYKSQEIIKMSFYDEKSYQQIAKELDTNPMAVSRAMKKALNKLFNIMADKTTGENNG